MSERTDTERPRGRCRAAYRITCGGVGPGCIHTHLDQSIKVSRMRILSRNQVGRGLVYCLRIAVFIPSAYLCPLLISLISLLPTFLEPSALPPHSLQCSEVDTEGKHTLNLQWPGSPCAQCASSSSSAYSKPQLASPAHLMEFLVHFGFCTTPLPTNNVFPR